MRALDEARALTEVDLEAHATLGHDGLREAGNCVLGSQDRVMNEERASDTSKTSETDSFEDLFGRPRPVGRAGNEVGSSVLTAERAHPPEREARQVVGSGEADSDHARSEFLQRFGPSVSKLGFTQVPNVLLDELIRCADLKPGATLVLIRLLRHWQSRERWPFPGQESLAEQTGQSLRSVQRIMAELRRKKLISQKPRHRKGTNDRTSDEYDLRPLIVMLHAIAEGLEGRLVYLDGEHVEVPLPPSSRADNPPD